MNEAMVSIIIPVFNREEFLLETLQSVINQSYKNWECIIVDDGSEEQALTVLFDFQKRDTRIHVHLRDRDPKGAPTCRNIGLSLAKGVFIIFLDSDDILSPICLAQRLALFDENGERDFLVFKGVLFNEHLSDSRFYWNVATEEKDIIRFLKLDALWQTSGPIYRSDFLKSMGGFRDGLDFWQDLDLHLRCLLMDGSYSKYFDLYPDHYIRAGSNETISRSISFPGSKYILGKRIEYYHFFLSTLNSSSYKSDAKVRHTIESTLYFLCAQYLIKYSSLLPFIVRWLKVKRFSPFSFLTFGISTTFVLLLKLSIRMSFLKSFVRWYFLNYGEKMPDYYILKDNKVTICPLSQKDMESLHLTRAVN